MNDRDDLIIIQAKTNSIKVDIETSINDDKKIYVPDICLRLKDIIDDMQKLIYDMEVVNE